MVLTTNTSVDTGAATANPNKPKTNHTPTPLGHIHQGCGMEASVNSVAAPNSSQTTVAGIAVRPGLIRRVNQGPTNAPALHEATTIKNAMVGRVLTQSASCRESLISKSAGGGYKLLLIDWTNATERPPAKKPTTAAPMNFAYFIFFSFIKLFVTV